MNFDQLLEVAKELLIPQELIEIWIPRDKFENAVREGSSLSITRFDDPFYGMAFGTNPVIDKRWRNFSVTRSTPKSITSEYKLVGQWDAYGMATKKFDVEYELIANVDVINEFIETHAPESSIRGGDQEVVTWVWIPGIALGALCKWESGAHVLSAIAVAKEQRGKGFGKAITKALVSEAYERNIKYVALGVYAKNDVAIATYRSIGFELLGQFNSFEI